MGGSVKVSVVIRTRNRAGLLAQAIGSVFVQTFEDYEVVVVDDASTDATPELLDSIAGARLRGVRHAARRGPVDPRRRKRAARAGREGLRGPANRHGGHGMGGAAISSGCGSIGFVE